MKKIIIAAIMLMGMCQNILAQTDGVDFSSDGIYQTLKRYQIVSLGSFHNGLARLVINQGGEERYGMINKFGKLVIPCEYPYEYSYLDDEVKMGEGLIVLYNSDKGLYGYFDVNGNCVLPFQYEKAEPFSEGLAAVKTPKDSSTESWRFIDKQGNTVIPPIEGLDDKRIGEFHDGVVAIGSRVKHAMYLIDKEGNEVLPPKPYRCYGYTEGFFIVRNEESVQGNRLYGLMDKTGKLIVPTEYVNIAHFSDGLAVAVNRDGKVGYIDLKGKIKISFQFERGRNFNNGIAVVVKDGKDVVINKEGEIIFTCPFERINNYSEGLAAVCKNGKWGFIDETGEIKILCQFDYVGDFSEGLAAVGLGGKWGYIDKHGKGFIR